MQLLQMNHEIIEYTSQDIEKALRTINQCKRKFWKNYVSNLNVPTPINKLWNTIRKIKGKGTAVKYKHGQFPLPCAAFSKASARERSPTKQYL